MTGRFDYQVFGLRIRSEFALPELFPAEDACLPDVTVWRGSINSVARDDEIQTDGTAMLLTIPDVARYRIEGGREIIVDPQEGAPERNLRLFLFGSAFGALLHQRGLLPLHANAIEIEGRAIAFMGESGSGKSTLAAWFVDCGYKVLADDVCVVGFDDEGNPHAYPGLPRLRLWNEVLVSLGRDRGGYERSYVGPSEQLEKFDVPMDRSAVARESASLAALYLLDRGESFCVEPLTGLDAAEAIFANTYRGSYVSAARTQQSHWQASVALVRSVPVFRVSRPWNLAELDDQCRGLLDHLHATMHLAGADAGGRR